MRAILITGSRSWTDAARIREDLAHELELAHPGRLYVLHGDCPTGADAITQEWLRVRADCDRIVGVPMPAPWDDRGRGAGPFRNRAMVDVLGTLRRLGAVTRCIGYPTRPTGGTRDCMGVADGYSHEVINHGTDGGAR